MSLGRLGGLASERRRGHHPFVSSENAGGCVASCCMPFGEIVLMLPDGPAKLNASDCGPSEETEEDDQLLGNVIMPSLGRICGTIVLPGGLGYNVVR